MRAVRWLTLMSLIGSFTALAGTPEVLTNAQGLAQQDLSIRGSSYSGAGISINGLNLKVPYSAHFNSELPRFGSAYSTAEIQSGPKNVSGHLVGTAALQIPMLDRGSSMAVGIGTDERYRASLFGSSTNIGGFIDWEKARLIDYDANDLERFSSGAFVQFSQNDWQFDILALSQSKKYGAQGYYGIPSSVYAEERTYDDLIYAGATRGDLYGSYLRGGFAYREFDQKYRIPTDTFANDVLSRYGSLMLEGRTLEVQNIALNLHGDLEHERVNGDIGAHHRTRGSVLILPELRLERVTITAGLNSVFQTDESPEWLPQAGIDFFATDNVRLFAAYSETVQQPDYQMLYYSDPYHINNTGLDLQHSQNIEMGLHQFISAKLDWQIAAFRRQHKNTIDWTKATAADTEWTATDLGTLDVSGIDAKLNYLATDTLNIQLYYQWITKDDIDVYAGLYELDYPEHLLALSGIWQLTPELRLFGFQTLRHQTDNNARSGNDFGAEASLGLHYDPRFANNVRLSFLVENLWDTDFQAIPGLNPRPRSIATGITVNW